MKFVSRVRNVTAIRLEIAAITVALIAVFAAMVWAVSSVPDPKPAMHAYTVTFTGAPVSAIAIAFSADGTEQVLTLPRMQAGPVDATAVTVTVTSAAGASSCIISDAHGTIIDQEQAGAEGVALCDTRTRQ